MARQCIFRFNSIYPYTYSLIRIVNFIVSFAYIYEFAFNSRSKRIYIWILFTLNANYIRRQEGHHEDVARVCIKKPEQHGAGLKIVSANKYCLKLTNLLWALSTSTRVRRQIIHFPVRSCLAIITVWIRVCVGKRSVDIF